MKVYKNPLSDNYNPRTESKLLTIDKIKVYQQLIGILNYMVSTVRVDLCLSVFLLAQRLAAPTKSNLRMAYRILKYAISTKSIGITYSNNGIKLKTYDPITKLPKERIMNKNTLDVISDATWADGTENRKSQYGFLILLNGNLISFKSKKLDNITLSTCEAEFCALSDAHKHTLGIKNLLMTYGSGDDEYKNQWY